MSDLAHQRCMNHAEREAVARCLACRHFFCRECVTEHDDRVLCASCLRRLARVPLFQRRGLGTVMRLCQCALGVLLAWFFFYLVGEGLLALPTAFHEGTVWHAGRADK